MSVFRLLDEPGVTGKLPDSFRNLTDLEWLDIEGTSMTSPPDYFGGMTKMKYVEFFSNPEMTGPLPESLGSSDNLQSLTIWWNSFTGTPPASWAKHYKYMSLWSNHLTGKIPETYLTGERVGEKLMTILMQQEGYGFDISELDIPGYWPDEIIEDVITGETFTFDDVISKNNYTVWLSWAPWCPFSKALMPQLLDYYRQYRQDGLEIIATVIINDDGSNWEDRDGQISAVKKSGYDNWYNYYFWDCNTKSYPASTPQAEVYDSKGNIVFSYSKYPGNDNQERFGHPASTDLIAFLETVIGPAEVPDPYTSTDYSRDGEVLTLQKATVGKGINIVFMGDAYTDRDMGKDGLYETVMRQAMDEFFAIEPYRTFRNRFNVYAVKVVSPNGRIGDGYTTALGSTFGNGTEIGGLVDKCYEYALKVPGINDRRDLLVNVIANTRRHSGTAMISESTMSAVTFTSSYGNDPEFMGNVLRHEAGGHGFGFLADEYTKYQAHVPQSQIESWNRLYDEYGIYANIDFTDDPAKVRWSAFLADERYKDEVGIYEGGGLYSLGAYRPSKNSMMNENFEYYNAPSRWAIYQRIMERSGEEYSFEKFLEYDAVNRGKAAAAARPPLKAAAAGSRRFEPTAPPVILP
jgi:thiol-disulfide isomerase/thioredoxin